MESTGGRRGRAGVYDDPPLANVVLDSLWIPNSSPPSSFHGSMMNFEDAEREAQTLVPLQTQIDPKVEDEVYSEKKRRLSPEQVVFLEKSFEVENKLEPERKLRLAKELGLQPRQVAIWFQNRRARYKTKLLQKEYDSLKSTYDSLKADYDSLYRQNQRTKNELKLLTDKLKPSSGDDPISPLDLLNAKNKARSVGDSDNHEDSSNALESDFSQDEDDGRRRKRRRRLDRVPPLQLGCFPAAAECCDDDLQPNSCNLGFPVLDQGTWFWQY